jgi:hypothetical protein
MTVNEDIDGWIVIGAEPGQRQLAFQRAREWVRPRRPDPAYPQQLHLAVTDADKAEQELLVLGATRLHGARETGFRVFADPVGHPLCIVFGRGGRAEHSPAPAAGRGVPAAAPRHRHGGRYWQ